MAEPSPTRPRGEGRRIIACLGECMLELSRAPDGNTRLGFGGDTLNTSVYLARVLDPTSWRVRYVTALGKDPFSDELVAAWTEEGIDRALVERLDGALPGLYVIRTAPDGERSFYYWRERAAVRSLLDDGRDRALAAALADTELLYLSGITLAVFTGERRERLYELLDACRASGMRLAFDTNYRPLLWPDPQAARDAYRRVGQRCDLVLPSLDDDMALFGDLHGRACADRWQGWGAREVVVKAGSEACTVSVDGDRIEVVPAPGASPVDTTAAGDAFAAAYLAARLEGEAPAAAARAGHALAGQVIAHPGALIPRA